MKKRLRSLTAAFCLAAAPLMAASPPAKARAPSGEVVLNLDTGKIVSKRQSCSRRLRYDNGECTVYLASLTKLVTAAIVWQEVKKGNVSLDDTVTISEHAADQPLDAVRIGLPAGSTLTLRDALAVMAKYSANDFAVAIAEHVGGSEENFVRMMNAYVKGLGFEHTHLGNPSGMPEPNIGGASRSTPVEMAKLVGVLSNNPLIQAYFNEEIYRYRNEDFGPRRVICYNNLQPVIYKTGYTNMSGSNIAYVHEADDGQRYSIVLFGYRRSFNRNARLVDIIDEISPDQAKKRLRKPPGC